MFRNFRKSCLRYKLAVNAFVCKNNTHNLHERAKMAPMLPSEPSALERTLRLALTSASSTTSSSNGTDANASVLHALLTDSALMRDAQHLFTQLVPRTSPSSATAAARTHPPASPFSLAFDRSTRLGRESEIDAALLHEKMSALVAVIATGVSREIQHEERATQSTTAAELPPLHASAKRKRQDPSTARTGSDQSQSTALPTWDLVALLTDAHVSLGAFLRHFTSLFDRLVLDPELLEVATQLKEEFTIATVLFEKYRVLWRKMVRSAPTGHVHEPLQRRLADQSEPEREDVTQRTPTRKRSEMLLEQQLVSVDRHAQLHDAGWLLFLIAKRRLSSHYTGLGQLYYLLLAVLHLVLTNVSAPSIEAEVAAALSALGAHVTGPNGSTSDAASMNATVLDALCANPKVDQHEVTRAAADVDAVLLQLQTADSFLETPEPGAPGALTLGLTGSDAAHAYARAVLHESVIGANVAGLSDHYRRAYVDGVGKLDERFYLDPFAYPVLMGPKSMPSVHASGTGATPSALSSPVPTKRPGRADRLIPPNPFGSPARQPGTPQRKDRTAVLRGLATPLGTSATAGAPPASPFTLQAWQLPGSSPPPMAVNARSMHTPNTRAFLHTATSHRAASPFVAQTPVTAAVETSNWIRDTLGHTSGFVTPHLKLFFRDCASDPTDAIAKTLHELSQRLLASRRRALSSSLTPSPSLDENSDISSQQLQQPPLALDADASLQKTKNLAIALFYRVLEALLVSERERLRTTNFSSLLHNDTFIASLFACSLEVVLKAHSLLTLAFPFLLDVVGVNAFDFGKIIESFVKHVPKLPNALKRHMRDIEQTILDSLAWRADSGLYVVLAGDAKPTPVSASEAMLASLTNGTPATTATAAGASSTTRTSVLQLFFRKVLSLAASRIFRLGTLLELDAKYLNQVWTAIKECISGHHDLLKDRHLDHVILCSLYGVCKVNHVRPEVTFKRVIDAYKKLQTQHHASGSGSATGTPLARASNDVIRNIKLDDTTRGDIIKFYNRCYIPTMKVFMLQFQVQDKQMAAADAVVASTTSSAHAASHAPPGFTPRREGSVVAASTSDTEIVAEAAADAVEKVMKAYGHASGPGTPNRLLRRASGAMGATSSPLSSLQLFRTAEVQSLPVSVHQTSPKRVLASNIYMSPLQQARLHAPRSHLTPRSHALYAFGESPSRVRLSVVCTCRDAPPGA